MDVFAVALETEAIDLACGIHWYCSDHHNGQWSPEYRAMCETGYRPGPMEIAPVGEDAVRIYEDLCTARLSLNQAMHALKVRLSR